MSDDLKRAATNLRSEGWDDEAAAVDAAADRIEELEAALRRMLIEFDFLIESGHLPDIRRDIIFDDARFALMEKKDDEGEKRND